MTCDMAQYYGVLDFRTLPVATAATLACGLPPESRVKLGLSGQRATLENRLLAAIADRLSVLVWFQTEDGRKGRRRPKSIVDAIMGEPERRNGSGDVEAFASIEAFEAAMAARGNVNAD